MKIFGSLLICLLSCLNAFSQNGIPDSIKEKIFQPFFTIDKISGSEGESIE
jgi:hypothetical protein